MCYLLVTGTFSCVLRVSDRFSEYKENPENTGFSGFVALFRYSVELSLAELRLSFGELQMPVFTGFFRFDVANTLQTQDFSLPLITPRSLYFLTQFTLSVKDSKTLLF